MGGEKQMERQAGRLWVGSPPRGRGKARGPRFFDVVGGITPAWAGKRRMSSSCVLRMRDHPRMGGEKAIALFRTSKASGSPPRGRGKVGPVIQLRAGAGITPA